MIFHNSFPSLAKTQTGTLQTYTQRWNDVETTVQRRIHVVYL